MSQTDMDDQADTRVDRPVVLVIQAPESQKYLEDNQVMEALYGENRPLRACTLAKDFPWELFIPQVDNDKTRLKLLDRFPSISVSEMPEFIQSDEFYMVVFQEIVVRSALEPEDIGNVRVIIAAQDFFMETGMPLMAVVKRYFPKASIFQAEYPGHGKPIRLFDSTS